MRIKSYSNVWKTEKVLYAINDLILPRPVTVSQILWALAFFLLSVILNGIPPFVFQDSMLMNHIAIPAVLAWFMGKRSFDGKRPDSFIRSYVKYLIRPKVWSKGRYVDLSDIKYQDIWITAGMKRNTGRMEKI